MTTMSISCIRGMAAHAVMPDMLSGETWRRMSRLKPSKFLTKLTHSIRRIDEYADMYKPLVDKREHDVWIAQCYEDLFTLCEEWGVRQLSIEPDLGAIILDNGYNLRFGMPDNLFYSPSLKGMVGLEIKTGEKKRRPENSKIMRYQVGLLRYTKTFKLPALRAVNWVSFAASSPCLKTGNVIPTERPVLYSYTVPLDVRKLSDWCLGQYGYTLSELTDLDRFATISTRKALSLAA